jgi:ectoine hydroxylase-related dioxygenase (phytanoyl-CoA dioxygenase family)
MAKKGDVLLWHAMLIHGGAPINDLAVTRWSMACHYFSQDCFGMTAGGLHSYGRASYMTKGVDDPH